jgi:subtilase family serine protease
VVALSVFVPAAGAAAGAAANPLLTTHVPATVATHQARRLGAPDPAESMDLAISLPTRNGAALHALLRDLYTQGSPLYRHYLSVPEFTARFGPSAADYAALRDFATAHHLAVTSLAANRRVLGVRGTVADIDAAFHITLGLYQVAGATRSFVAPDREPQIDLAVPVLHISGLDTEILPYTHLVRGDAAAQSRIVATGSHLATGPHLATGSGPHGNFIGSDIRAAYYGGSKLTGAGQSVGLLEYAGYNINDVLNYFKHVEQPFTVPIFGVSLDGANLNCTGKCDDSEQVLDIEEAISMAPSLSKLVVYVGKLDVSMLNQMAVDDSCKQLSSSWGWKADASTIDPILEEFAAQGQSFVDATGDDGYELLKDAVWPGDDQNVTGVGGTDLKTTGPGGKWLAELAWHYSGGGPSPDHILIPAYQVPFITPVNNGNHRLRNVPDIAGDANTDNYSCYDGGCYTGNGGTSYAAPLWAGFIALVNEQAEAAGKPPVGFLNPTIYTLGGSSAYKTVFHDQIYGNNGRYIAEPGFDLTTGFGSPAGQALIDALAGTAAGVK